jgi:hypothetical protein
MVTLLTGTTAMFLAVIQFAIKRLFAMWADLFFRKHDICFKVIFVAISAISEVFTPMF